MRKFLLNNWFVFCTILMLSFVLYGNGIRGDFVFDDRSVIVGNPLVEDISGTWKAFVNPYHYARPQSGLYRPLTFASYTLNWHISQSPASFHVVNIFLHALASFFVFLIIISLKDRRAAAIGSLIFLFLPIHVESVTSIVGRGELLALLFLAAAFYASIKERYSIAAISFGAALLSKEVSIAFLPIFIFFEFAWRRKNIKEILKNTLLLCVPLGVYGTLRYNALGADYFISTNAYSFFNPIRTAGFFPGTWTAFKVLSLYAQKLIYPTYFSSDYSYGQIAIVQNLWGSWQAIAGIAIFLGLIFFAIKKRDGLVSLGCFVFLSSYFVVSNLLVKTGTIMAERLMYMPSFGFAMIVSGLASDAFERLRRIRVVVFCVFVLVLFLYGIRIVSGNALWNDEKTLFENAYQKAPLSVVNISNKASILFRDGKDQEALDKISEALAVEPQNAPALHLAGQIYMSMGQKKKAEAAWKTAIDAQPDYLYPYLSLGAMYYTTENFQAGESILSVARTMYDTPNVIELLSFNLIGLRKYEDAISVLEDHFGDSPKEFEPRFILGVSYLKMGQDQKARELLLGLKDSGISDEEFIKLLKTTRVFQIQIL